MSEPPLRCKIFGHKWECSGGAESQDALNIKFTCRRCDKHKTIDGYAPRLLVPQLSRNPEKLVKDLEDGEYTYLKGLRRDESNCEGTDWEYYQECPDCGFRTEL